MAKYNKIKLSTIANGDGDRIAIFFSGCDIHCDGCFNSELWDPNNGEEFTDETYDFIKSNMTNHKRGLSILGGEPFSKYNVECVASLVRKFKADFPDKTIYVWSGYSYDYLKSLNNIYVDEILSIVNILVDGPFIEKYKDYSLNMRGSSNQNIIKIR